MDNASRAPLKPNPRTTSNFFSAHTFSWTIPFFHKGLKCEMDESDLYQPLPEHASGLIGGRLERKWDEEKSRAKAQGRRPSLLRAMIKCFGVEFCWQGVIIAFTELCVKVPQPIFLGHLVAYFSADNTAAPSNAYMHGSLLVAFSFISVLFHHPYMMNMTHLGMKLRVATCSLIYRKMMRLSPTALRETTPGQMVNLLSNDVNRFDMALFFAHYLWLGPLQTLIVTILLSFEIGLVPAIVGIAGLMIFAPLQGYFGKWTTVCRQKVALCTDERVRLMNEIVGAIRVIKMYAWELPFQKLMDEARKSELKQVTNMNYVRGTLASFLMYAMRFAIFMTVLACVFEGDRITGRTVFLITAYFTTLRQNMNLLFPQAISMVAEGLVSVRRIQKSLLLPELRINPCKDQNLKEDLSFSNVSAKWYEGQHENTLSELSLSIKTGALTAVVGAVGSGKSSLLHAILGELATNTGTVNVSGAISYAAQEPWLFAGTVRQNILFGVPLESTRYAAVLDACALREDLAALPNGDLTLVGDKGVVLSGGQKSRINLARAVYRDADIYLLDDPLSAVDAHVSAVLFEECILKFLSGKTRVLVTHQLQYLPQVDQVLYLAEGRLIASGTYAEVRDAGLDALSCALSEDTAVEDGDGEATPGGREAQVNSKPKESTAVNTAAKSEARAQGTVKWKTFSGYFKSARSTFYLVSTIIMFVLSRVLASIGDYWIKVWVDFEDRNATMWNSSVIAESTSQSGYNWSPDRQMFVFGYTAIIVVLLVATQIRSFLFFHLCIRSSRNLHDQMFAAISHATMRFFNTTPSGQILNRFSKDMGSIDEVMPLCILDTFQIGLSLLSVFVLVAIVNYILIVPVAVIVVISYWLRSVFLVTSCKVKRLEAATRSPVFSHLNATLGGLTTIRVNQMQSKLIHEFDCHQDLHSSAWYLYIATIRAFAYSTDLLCNVFIASVTFSFLFGSHLGINGGNVGLAITQALSLMGMLQWGARQEAEVENHMISVERVFEYCDLPAEPALESPVDKRPPSTWPEMGRIEFSNVDLLYDPAGPSVLKNVTFTIKAGEKVGVVGRTGAGKTSLVSALFRLEQVRGSIQIDNIDTSSLGLHDLRRKISIIPQEPVLFKGTLRRNLDPFDEYSDDTLWSALKQVELEGVAERLDGRLDSPIQDGGRDLSVGERQLLCLARAVLRNNPILVLDEATANVDPRTDAMIQKMIRDKFKRSTVLTIAHRLHTVIDSDKVLVMDAGKVAEFDHPHVLLSDTKGLLYGMVQQIGGLASKKLIDIAFEKFESGIIKSPEE